MNSANRLNSINPQIESLLLCRRMHPAKFNINADFKDVEYPLEIFKAKNIIN